MLQHILLIRHAECEMNLHLSTTIGGRANDSPLTRRGKAQAEALAKRLARLPPQRRPKLLFASTAVRARETAEAVARELSLAALLPEPLPVSLSDDLLEIEMGDWAGKDRKSTYTDEVLEQIRRDPSGFAAPGGESQAEVEERVARFVESEVLPAAAELAREEAAAGLSPPPPLPVVAVVAHGVAIKVLLRRLLASDPRAFAAARNIALENTGISEVAVDTSRKSASALGFGGREERDGESPSRSSWDRELWHLVRVNDAAHLEGMGEVAEEGGEAEEEDEVSSPRIDR